MLTYILYRNKSMLMSATSRKVQPEPDLHPVQNPEYAPVSNKQEWQPDAHLHPVQNPEHAPVSNRQKGPARC